MERVIVIAEAGVNHNGSMELAKKLIDVAADAKADYVKFQTYKAAKLVSETAEMAEYQKVNMRSEAMQSQYAMLKKYELSHDDHYELIEYCGMKNINFLSTGFDDESLDFLKSIGMPLFKIPSGSVTDIRYLEKIASFQKPIILSTGMSTLDEVKDAIEVLISNGVSKNAITVLHCNTQYPTPMSDVNLLAMQHLATELNVKIGYSDHTLGIEVPIAAVALGAVVIEKHFTLDRSLEGPDHAASLEPDELKQMVACLRNIEIAISGSGYKEVSSSERLNRNIARKSIHLSRKLEKGTFISESDLEFLRPGDGISPMQVNKVVGRQLQRDLSAGTKLSWEDIS